MGVVVNPQIVILYDANGVAMAVQDGVAIPASTPAILVAGSDGTNAKYMRTAADGTVRTDPTGTTTQPVSAASLPLPTGAATSANQTTLGNQTTKINDGTNTAAVTGANALKVDGSAVTQPVSAAGLPLPTGAATSANQTGGGQKTQIVDGSGNVMPSQDTAARAAFAKVTDGTNTAAVTGASALKVDGSAVTQPISAASLPLPSGAAQEHTTAASPTSTRLSDGAAFYDAAKTGQLPSALTGSGNLKAAIVEFTAAIPTGSNTIGKVDQGAANTAANRWPTYPTDGTNNMPMLDAAARAGFFKRTDGTNVAPTGDVAARKMFVQPTDGTNTAGYDAQNHAFVAGKSAVGVAPTGNPVAVSGVDDAGLKRALLTHTDGSTRTIPASHRVVLFNNGTITTSGSQVISGIGMSEWYLIINLKNAPTGTSPTITFKIEAVDPLDQTTVIDATTTEIGATHTTAGVEAIQLADNITDTVKITWTVTGTTPSWTGVNVTWVGHVAGNAIEGQAEEGQPLSEGPVPVAGVDASNNVHTLKVAADGSLIVAATGTDKSNGSRVGYVALGGGTSGTFNAVRATAYNEQTTNAQRSLSSLSVLDASAGTGARTVEITYYDQTCAGPFTETVTLNGLTAVNTVNTNICFIESMVVKTVGTLGSNQGTVTLWTGTGGLGTAIGTIAVGTLVALVGDNRTFWAHHYVPTGKTCRVSTFVVGASASSNFLFRTKNPTSSISPEVLLDAGIVTASGEFRRDSSTPPPITGPARVVLYAIPSTNNVTINGTFDFYE